MIPVYENYRDYQPPRYVYPTICRLLSCVPENYLSGLALIVLTNAEAVGKGKTRRVAGKKYARRDCLGFYHPERKGEAAWIEIVVDNILAESFGTVRVLSYIPVARDVSFARVLYHEIGHHLDRTIGAPAPSGEEAAEAWMKNLARPYFRRRYWYVRPFLSPAERLLEWCLKIAKRRAGFDKL